MKKIFTLMLLCTATFITLTSEDGCSSPPVSTSGVKKSTIKLETDLNGKTIEQKNVAERMIQDNKPGSIKHLYIISAYSGEVLIYSTVKGKVTSSGKRLNPSTVNGSGSNGLGFAVDFGNGHVYYTDEVLGDDGTYGSSAECIYWWDSKNIYHQQFVAGGMILHISSEPIAVKSVIMNFENSATGTK